MTRNQKTIDFVGLGFCSNTNLLRQISFSLKHTYTHHLFPDEFVRVPTSSPCPMISNGIE